MEAAHISLQQNHRSFCPAPLGLSVGFSISLVSFEQPRRNWESAACEGPEEGHFGLATVLRSCVLPQDIDQHRGLRSVKTWWLAVKVPNDSAACPITLLGLTFQFPMLSNEVFNQLNEPEGIKKPSANNIHSLFLLVEDEETK